MLHTKFTGHQPSDFWVNDLRVLLYMGVAAISSGGREHFKNFSFTVPGGCILNLLTIGLVVSEKKLFEIVDERPDGRTTVPLYPISFPGAFGSVELKSTCVKNLFIFTNTHRHEFSMFVRSVQLLKLNDCKLCEDLITKSYY